MFCDYIQPKIKLQKDVQKKMTPGVKVKNNQESKKKTTPHLGHWQELTAKNLNQNSRLLDEKGD